MSDADMSSMEQANDATSLQELIENRRVIEHPELGKVVLHRPTPKVEMKIAEERRKQFQRDIRDDSILSRAELKKIYERRGIWTTEDEARMEELGTRLGELMVFLDGTGFKTVNELVERFGEVRRELKEQFPEDEDVQNRIILYMDLDLDPDQSDKKAILEESTSSEVSHLLDEGDLLRAQVHALKEFQDVKEEFDDFQRERAQLFTGSVESRADRAEAFAKLYHCCLNEDGDHLAPTFDEFLDLDSYLILFLRQEHEYFETGMTEDMRGMFEKYGFTPRGIITGSDSEGSQDPPKSSSDGEPEERPQSDSSE